MNAPVGVKTILRPRGTRLSLRVDTRAAAVCTVLLAGLAALSALALTTGDFPITAVQALNALIGRGEPGHVFIVITLRLPRLLTAVSVGAALAVSGALLQRLSGNPLGSPDIIGFTNGAATGALIVIIVVGGSMLQIGAGALIGGTATAFVIFLLAFTPGASGSRFVLVGIGVSAVALAANSYLITRAEPQDALAAQAWLVGSLNGRGWPQVLAVGIVLAVLLPVALYHGRALAMLEMGEDSARALGVAVGRVRLVLTVVSVALAAIATAATGPILFVALAAPQLARRLTRSCGPGLVASALMGALLLVAGDFAAQQAFPSAQLPVGTATGLLGGLYFCWLLTLRQRRERPWHRR